MSSFSVDEAKQRILYTVNEAGYTRLFALDARTLAPVALPTLPAGADHVYSGTTTRDGRFTTFGVETATAPRTSYVYDWNKEALTKWVVPSAPGMDTSTFSVATLEEYPARDGTMIPVFVRRPRQQGTGPAPVIVEFHGGPEAQAQPGFSPYAQMFVDAGFVFVEPNVRGSDGYGQAWLDADNGAKRLNVLDGHRGRGHLGANCLCRGWPGTQSGRHGRQLWRLRSAGGHDAVRRRLRCGRVHRRHQQPA